MKKTLILSAAAALLPIAAAAQNPTAVSAPKTSDDQFTTVKEIPVT